MIGKSAIYQLHFNVDLIFCSFRTQYINEPSKQSSMHLLFLNVQFFLIPFETKFLFHTHTHTQMGSTAHKHNRKLYISFYSNHSSYVFYVITFILLAKNVSNLQGKNNELKHSLKKNKKNRCSKRDTFRMKKTLLYRRYVTITFKLIFFKSLQVKIKKSI